MRQPISRMTAVFLALAVMASVLVLPASAAAQYTYSNAQIRQIQKCYKDHGYVQKESFSKNKKELVKNIQTMLNELGYGKLAVDGVFGSATTKAVKSFQKSSGLTQDGIVGTQTWNALVNKYTACMNTKITFNSISAPNTKQGKDVGLSGNITSVNSKLVYVTGTILNSAGASVGTKGVAINTFNYNLSGCGIDKILNFGNLGAGTYTLRYDVRAANGATASLSKVFTVTGTSGYNSAASIQYANAHWNDGKGQCAEFVSRCLMAGNGIPSVYTGAGTLKRALEATGKGHLYQLTVEADGRVKASRNAGKLSPGDPIFMYCSRETDGKPWIHTVLYSGTDSNGYAKVYAHNRAYGNQVYWGFNHCGFCGASGNSKVQAYVYHYN